MQQTLETIVLVQRERWARVRLRGLLKNSELAAHLQARDAAVHASAATGTVRLPLSPERDLAHWMEWLREATIQGPRRAPRRARREAAGFTRPARTESPAESLPPPEHASSCAGPQHHGRKLDVLLAELGGDTPLDAARGLSAGEARARLKRDGPNQLPELAGRSDREILLDQFKSVPVALLGGAAALALATRAVTDAVAIAAVLGANASLGFATERSAERTVAGLRKLGPAEATVWRDGQAVVIDAAKVVVGDVLVFKPGESIAADARVIEAHRLAVNEAALTGESLPVRKEPVEALPAKTPLGQRRNTVYMGTVVSGGTGRAVVVATAQQSELGRIQHLAEGAQSPRTHLQEELDTLGRKLAVGAAGLCVGVVGLGLLRGRAGLPLLRTAVSLGVAAIPEGLPTVATSLLASAVRRLQGEGIYARRLGAVESLGAVDTVCFDKTGTLTQNRMSVASLTVGAELRLLELDTAPPDLPEAWLQVAVLCNTVERNGDGPVQSTAVPPRRVRAGEPGASNDSGSWQGSSTEVALLEFAESRGARARALRRRFPVSAVRHRSEHHPYMVTLHPAGRGLLVLAKGRPDEVLARCDRWFDGRTTRALGAADRRRLLQLNDEMARLGHRVLALAWRRHPTQAYGATSGLTWLGLAGFADPLRDGLPEMMERFRQAGIRTMMLTGDQLPTARAVARSAGLDPARELADAAALPEDASQLGEVIASVGGFARTSPAMKLEIVRALQAAGHVVAMTGDGINDGPALKKADVGIAMGDSGTDFAHAMSDLVLRDDDPAAMLEAVSQGRTAFRNVRKSVRYLVATNLSELAATVLAVALGREEPLDPMALLWTNIVTDIWPAIALGLEPAEPGVLREPPVSLRDGLLDRKEWRMLLTDAGSMAAVTLASHAWAQARYGPGPKARTLAFMTLTCSQLLYAPAIRSPVPLRKGGLQPNPLLKRAVAVSMAAQAGTVLLPFARRILRTTPLGLADVVVVAASSVVPLLLREALKERTA